MPLNRFPNQPQGEGLINVLMNKFFQMDRNPEITQSDTSWVINPLKMKKESGFRKSYENINKLNKRRIAVEQVDPKQGILIDQEGNTWYFDKDALDLNQIKPGETNILDVEESFNVIYKAYEPITPDVDFLQTKIGTIKGEK